MEINWNDGELIDLDKSDSLMARDLSKTDLYGVFLRGNENRWFTYVGIGSGDGDVIARIPPASWGPDYALALVTNTSYISVGTNEKVTAFLGSVAMPLDRSGIKDREFETDDLQVGQYITDSFWDRTRFSMVPAGERYEATVERDESSPQAVVMKFNRPNSKLVVLGWDDPNLYATKSTRGNFDLEKHEDSFSEKWFNGQSVVWMNANGAAKGATLSVGIPAKTSTSDSSGGS
ncbi:hypothetical protein [Actinopolyspora xinjiangensis]|uniref:hypothetical protein n=1 Tax=Actinopolyspora xinjiangensis TaxID=405564 RepID=UPI00111367B1|nr:hypothetical protein [Actinopolyspora xinjiangensis]